MNDASRLLSPNFLFRYSIPLRYCARSWPDDAMELEDHFQIPSFCELDDKPGFGDFRLGWNETGLSWSVRVQGKHQNPWCRTSRLEDSDGLHLFLDTRDTQNIHRASRFCHYFAFLPQGAGRQEEDPFATLHVILRSKENPKPIPENSLPIRAEKRIDGYLLRGWIPASALTGYDTSEHRRLGFTYLLADRELGWQPFSLGSEFPFTSDPSLWGSLELVAAEG